MPSRKVERFTADDLEIGAVYSRPQIAAIGHVAELSNPREWGGFVEFLNEIQIYVTLHKTRNEPQHMYRDRIESDTLYWDSRARHTHGSLQIRKLLSGDKPVRFFCRIDDRDPFVHCGHLAHVSHTGSEPVAFTWRLVAHAKLSGLDVFERLARWVPDVGRRSTDQTPGQRTANRERAFAEGWAVQVTANRYERDPDARNACLEHHGYACWVCDFQFGAVYGEFGHEFAFVHHRRPVAQRVAEGPYVVDPKTELIPICGNCHAMAHRSAKLAPSSNPGVLTDKSWRRLLTLRAEVSEESWDEL